MKKRIEAALPDRHADLHRRARVDTTALAWEASPSGTVWRQPLYRVGGEHGPVTSLVRYAPGDRSARTPIPRARKSWCWRGCSPTNTAIIRPNLSASIPTAATTPRVPTGVACCSCACANIPARIGRESSWTPRPGVGARTGAGHRAAASLRPRGLSDRVHLERWAPGATRPGSGFRRRGDLHPGRTLVTRMATMARALAALSAW